MSKSSELFGVDAPLLTLEDRLPPEASLELELLWPPENGRFRLDCVCNCMNDSWLIVKLAAEFVSGVVVARLCHKLIDFAIGQAVEVFITVCRMLLLFVLLREMIL